MKVNHQWSYRKSLLENEKGNNITVKIYVANMKLFEIQKEDRRTYILLKLSFDDNKIKRYLSIATRKCYEVLDYDVKSLEQTDASLWERIEKLERGRELKWEEEPLARLRKEKLLSSPSKWSRGKRIVVRNIERWDAEEVVDSCQDGKSK
jgi:hypothetical protein